MDDGGDVYKALDPYGVSVIGGRILHIGVEGLIMGVRTLVEKAGFKEMADEKSPVKGEFFHFSGQYGMAADNVKNFQV